MPNYGLIENNKIVNIIVAESLEIAESVTQKSAILIDETELGIDSEFIDGYWTPIKPYPSWVWNGEAWESPVPKPTDDGVSLYNWSEEDKEWKEFS